MKKEVNKKELKEAIKFLKKFTTLSYANKIKLINRLEKRLEK